MQASAGGCILLFTSSVNIRVAGIEKASEFHMPASPDEAALSAACLMDPVEDLLILPNPNLKHRKSQRSQWPAARSTDSGSLAWPHARMRTIGNFSLDAIIGSSDTAPPISHSAMHLNRKVGTRGFLWPQSGRLQEGSVSSCLRGRDEELAEPSVPRSDWPRGFSKACSLDKDPAKNALSFRHWTGAGFGRKLAQVAIAR